MEAQVVVSMDELSYPLVEVIECTGLSAQELNVMDGVSINYDWLDEWMVPQGIVTFDDMTELVLFKLTHWHAHADS